MKRILVFFISIMTVMPLCAQNFSSDRIAFAKFLERMYVNSPFEGVRAVNNYDQAFLISVLALNKAKYESESVLNRVASVKAMAQANRYFNGSNITQDMIIHTTEKADGTSDTEILEEIKEHSVGYVKALELMTNFQYGEGQQVFIFIAPLKINSREENLFIK